MGKKCTIQYRYVNASELNDGFNLKDTIVSVLRRRQDGRSMGESARLRVKDLDQDGSLVILNKISSPESWDGNAFYGQLIQIDNSAEVHAITESIEEDADEYTLQNIDVGEQAKILKGALYFAVVGNHLGVIEGHQVRGRTLERYLTRVFQDHNVFEPGTGIKLNSSFRTADGRGLDASTEVTIAARRSTREDEPAPIGRIVEQEAAQERERGATVFDVLRMLGWTDEAVERLREEVPNGGWVEGLFKVVIKEKRARRPISRATIDEALRNLDPDDIGLRGDGSEKGGLVKLSVQKEVQAIGSLIDPEDAMIKIIEAIRDWAISGKIDCDFVG